MGFERPAAVTELGATVLDALLTEKPQSLLALIFIHVGEVVEYDRSDVGHRR